MKVYIVWHATSGDHDSFVAVYSTREKAEARIRGFVVPSRLRVEEVEVDED